MRHLGSDISVVFGNVASHSAAASSDANSFAIATLADSAQPPSVIGLSVATIEEVRPLNEHVIMLNLSTQFRLSGRG